MVLLILHQRLHELCLHCQKLLNCQWRWWWWMWGNTSMTSASSSSRRLPSNINIQILEISMLEYILKIFRTSSNISSSVKQSYLEFHISKRDVLYMVGKLKKLSTTFIQTTFPDSVVRLLKNRIKPKLFLDSSLRRNFILKQRYLTNQIRYEGDSKGIGNILKSSSHKNFISFPTI